MVKAVCFFGVAALAGVLLFAWATCRNRQSEDQGDGPRGDPGQAHTGPLFHGMSDASAAAAVDKDRFVVADDENNVLRVYTIGGGRPVARFDLTRFLNVTPESPEADIEGATRIGDRVYWITSHGRNRNGKWRPNRHRFFATKLTVDAGGVTIRGIGLPCTKLAEKMAGDATIRALCPEIEASLGLDPPVDTRRKRFAPKKDGLNIEALCAAPDGRTLYIGLRNPRVPDRTGRPPRAIVVPLTNAAQVVDAARRPAFGRPLLWDLAGLGVRGMEYSSRHKTFYVIAGPHDGEPGWALYRWSGAANAQPVLVKQAAPGRYPLGPEALVVFKDSSNLLLLSDDGALSIPVSGPAECLKGEFRSDGTCLNKHLRDQEKKYFRGVWLQHPARDE